MLFFRSHFRAHSNLGWYLSHIGGFCWLLNVCFLDSGHNHSLTSNTSERTKERVNYKAKSVVEMEMRSDIWLDHFFLFLFSFFRLGSWTFFGYLLFCFCLCERIYYLFAETQNLRAYDLLAIAKVHTVPTAEQQKRICESYWNNENQAKWLSAMNCENVWKLRLLFRIPFFSICVCPFTRVSINHEFHR